MLFGDVEIAQKIIETDDPAEHKRLGRLVRNFSEAIWEQVRFDIMVVGLYEKFRQNPNLAKALLDTCGTSLVEASPFDKIWGIGLAASDPRAQDRSTWLGLNLLGQVLDKVREMLEGSV